jgi:hypothetical protein
VSGEPARRAVERSTAGGLDVLTVDNGALRLVFLPQVGGRLISLRVLGSEVLWRNPQWLTEVLSPTSPHASWPRPDGTMGSWVNVGGAKTWPAPQGRSGPHEWPGPPDEVLDSGAYTAEHEVAADGSVVVRLSSAADPRTGLQVDRTFRVRPHETSFTQVSTFTNTSGHPVRWSIWEVAQVDTRAPGGGDRGHVEVRTGPGVAVVDLLSVTGRPTRVVGDGHVRVPVQDVVAKLGFPAATGTITWCRGDGLRLSLDIAVRRPVDHPDGGCPVELWLQHPVPAPLPGLGGLHPDADLVELEVLGPLETLPPLGRTSLTTTWTATPAVA